MDIFRYFNPDEPHQANGNFAGLPHAGNMANIFYLPIPWDATTSGMKGTAHGPENILRYSLDIDLFDHKTPGAYRLGHQFIAIDDEILALNMKTRDKVEVYRDNPIDRNEINQVCARVHNHVYEQVRQLMSDNRLIVLIGGEHSVSFGSIRAHLERYPKLNVVQLDAHMDLRNSYEGLKHSHASVFYNALSDLPLDGLFQIGIRDFCQHEWLLAQNDKRIHVKSAEELFRGIACGIFFEEQIKSFLEPLTEEVYLTVDIDVLEPHLCPGTGTPVPGGLQFWDILEIIDVICSSGRRIVGLDLVETGGENYIDGFTAGKLLYLMSSRAYYHATKLT